MKNVYLGIIIVSISVLGYVVFEKARPILNAEMAQGKQVLMQSTETKLGSDKNTRKNSKSSSMPMHQQKVKITIKADSEDLVRKIEQESVDRPLKIKNSIDVFMGLIDKAKKAHFKSIERNVFAEMAEDPEYQSIAQDIICKRSIQQELEDDGAVARVFYTKYLRYIAQNGNVAPLAKSISCLYETIERGVTWKGIDADIEELVIGYLKNVSQERVLDEYPDLMLNLNIDFSQQVLDEDNILTQPLLRAFMVRVIGSKPHHELQDYYNRYFPRIVGN